MTIGIDITLDEVSKTAASITNINKRLHDKLAEVMAEMEALSSSWDSDASVTIRAKFKSLQPKFDEYQAVVKSYADFLDFTVLSYTETESTINNDAGKFR